MANENKMTCPSCGQEITGFSPEDLKKNAHQHKAEHHSK